jgi:hypothetical protein
MGYPYSIPFESLLYSKQAWARLKKGAISNLQISILKKKFSGIKKSHIILVKISPFRMKKFDINDLIRYETFYNDLFLRYLILTSFKQNISFKHY